MERGPMPTKCAAWGGIVLGIGTLAYALFSPSNAGCSTNLVVLTHSAVTARGCAASSLLAHLGVGMIVLGAVLLLGSFILLVRNRRQAPADEVAGIGTGASGSLATGEANGARIAAPAPAPAPAPEHAPEPAPAPAPPTDPATPAPPRAPMARNSDGVARVESPGGQDPEREGPIPPGPIAPGAGGPERNCAKDGRPVGMDPNPPVPVALPPGWYGNPDTPGKPVQWWDGTRLTDRPPRSGR